MSKFILFLSIIVAMLTGIALGIILYVSVNTLNTLKEEKKNPKMCIYRGVDNQWYKDTDNCMKSGFYPCSDSLHTELIEFRIVNKH